MSKKDFKTGVNPATMFINTQAEPDAEPDTPKVKKEPARKVNKPMPEAKPVKAPEPEKETKSKRLNLLVQPSVLEDFNKVAFMQHNSMNDIINGLMKSYCDAHREEINTYNKYFNKGE